VEQIARTTDDRTLAMREGGDLAGRPVLAHVGMPGSSLHGGVPALAGAGHGLRVIGYDRSGNGGPESLPGRAVAGCGDDVRVICAAGAGTLGLLSVLLARDRVREIAVTARYPRQRALVEQLGATALGEGDWQEWAREYRPDVVIETAGGSGDTLNVGVQAARRGGRLIIVGLMGSVPVDIGEVTFGELSIIGSFIYGAGRGGEFAAAVGLLPRWQPELTLPQSHQFKLESIQEAFRCASDKSTGAVKVSVTR
jgi:threonine dehydrogenase-like Zn-dependent dehydrogenase